MQTPHKSPGVSLGVRLAAVGDALHGPKPNCELDPLSVVRADLDRDRPLVEAMIAAESKLIAWLRASQTNTTRFAMDPMGALREALPDFSPSLLARIATLRAKAQRVRPDLAGLKVDRFEVSVAGGVK